VEEEDRARARIAVLDDVEVDAPASRELDSDQGARERNRRLEPRRERWSRSARGCDQLGSREL
jgi:hypothetical protein